MVEPSPSVKAIVAAPNATVVAAPNAFTVVAVVLSNATVVWFEVITEVFSATAVVEDNVIVVDAPAPMLIAVAAPPKLMVVAVVFAIATVVWFVVHADEFNAMPVVNEHVKVDAAPAPMLMAVAAPPKLMVVLTVLKSAWVAAPTRGRVIVIAPPVARVIVMGLSMVVPASFEAVISKLLPASEPLSALLFTPNMKRFDPAVWKK